MVFIYAFTNSKRTLTNSKRILTKRHGLFKINNLGLSQQFNNIKNLTILTTKKKHLHLIELKELKKENQELKQLIKNKYFEKPKVYSCLL